MNRKKILMVGLILALSIGCATLKKVAGKIVGTSFLSLEETIEESMVRPAIYEEDIYWQAKEGYKLTAFPSDTAQGGFFHTDQLALIDQEGKIRGYYDGTSTKAVDQLFTDLHLSLKK